MHSFRFPHSKSWKERARTSCFSISLFLLLLLVAAGNRACCRPVFPLLQTHLHTNADLLQIRASQYLERFKFLKVHSHRRCFPVAHSTERTQEFPRRTPKAPKRSQPRVNDAKLRNEKQEKKSKQRPCRANAN